MTDEGDLHLTRVGKYFLTFALALLTVPATAVAGYYEISTDADSYLKEAAPVEPHGSAVELPNKSTPGDNLRSVWRFDLSSIPAGETVVSASTIRHPSFKQRVGRPARRKIN